MRHETLKTGTEFTNRKGETAIILKQTKCKKGNYWYECYNSDDGETKDIQYSNLRAGNFTFSKYEYEDRELYDKLRCAYDHILERCRKRPSYQNVKVEFDKFVDFYDYMEEFLSQNPEIKRAYLDGYLVLDKDLLSELLILSGEELLKKYSRDTILFVDNHTNGSTIKKACNLKDPDEKRKELMRILKQIDGNKYQKMKKDLSTQEAKLV